MYGRIVLDIDGERFDEPFDDAKEVTGAASDAAHPGRRPRRPVRDVQADRRGRRPASRSPRTRPTQLRGAIEAVFRSWNGARAVAYRVRERIPHDLGTAVNVQAMVFGNRDDNSGTGVGFTRDPATGAQGEYGDFLVNAQGEDVVAGIRNTVPLAALEDALPEGLQGAAGHLRPARGPLPRHVRHRVHHRRRASCGCCRPGSASAPARRRSAWRST